MLLWCFEWSKITIVELASSWFLQPGDKRALREQHKSSILLSVLQSNHWRRKLNRMLQLSKFRYIIKSLIVFKSEERVIYLRVVQKLLFLTNFINSSKRKLHSSVHWKSFIPHILIPAPISEGKSFRYCRRRCSLQELPVKSSNSASISLLSQACEGK